MLAPEVAHEIVTDWSELYVPDATPNIGIAVCGVGFGGFDGPELLDPPPHDKIARRAKNRTVQQYPSCRDGTATVNDFTLAPYRTTEAVSGCPRRFPWLMLI